MTSTVSSSVGSTTLTGSNASATAAVSDAPQYYAYDPSLAAAAIFAGVFAISALIHAFQMFATRTWYMTPMFLGVLFEVVGYAARAVNANQTPDWSRGVFVIQTVLILLGPPLMAASIYMEFGRIILLVDGASNSLVKPRWLTSIFVTGDVIAFFTQAVGGVMTTMDDPDTADTGQNVVLAGLYVQVVVFGFFILNGLLFYARMNRQPTLPSAHVPWRRHYGAVLITSLFILIRSIYRIVEYVQGRDGTLMTHEVYLYTLDAAVMLLTAYIMNALHPSMVKAYLQGGKCAEFWRIREIKAWSGGNYRLEEPVQARSS